MRPMIAAAVAVLFALPALADETQGQILAYDRVSNILVLSDKTVWQLPATLEVPADLVAGDSVKLVYTTSGEDGVKSIDALTRVAN
ncbi:hypothetical protein MAA8898_01760 [Maliponia aquimaris]|uniref:DUF1344 domain-containing protein n=2 Tax=Maliponia aquimaris TaxID=1673631 RepID=A0A238K7K7_9RHOB|nr:hypothetical protein MAA8898_01760 [Maliponia aquimaris]